MPRIKKEGKFVNIFMDNKVYQRLVAHCDKTGQSKTIAIERAIVEYTKKKADD